MRINCWRIGLWTAFLAAAVLQAPSAAAEEADYVGHKKCKMCHSKKSQGEQWKIWTQMNHAKAFETLSTDQAKIYGEEAGLTAPPQESAECLRCHVTAYNVEAKAPHKAIAKEDGVQCESCHGPGSEHLVFGKKNMTAKDIPADVPRHMVRPDVTACTECHNEESPAWDTEKYTLEDGSTSGFDFEQAFAKIAHFNPEKER